VLVIAAPGQGAQTPGFLSPWLEDAHLAADLAAYSDAARVDLVHYGTAADASAIRDTSVAQPLLVAAGLLTGSAVLGIGDESGPVHPDLWTGHSVGEVTVAGLSGILSPEEAMRIVAERGRAMAEASAARPTGMTAVLGGERQEVLEVLARHGLTAANDNGPGQVVAAGTMDQLSALAADPPAKSRIIPLSVAGAFHTEHMSTAVARLATAAAATAPAAPSAPLVSNRDGALVPDGAEVVERIVGQVANPVRWDLCMQTLLAHGVTGLLELSPAGTLTGIARRAMPGIATFALKSPAQLVAAQAFCAEHANVRSAP
jgi:[acyl-carrier-protein] S-malonyltransferase